MQNDSRAKQLQIDTNQPQNYTKQLQKTTAEAHKQPHDNAKKLLKNDYNVTQNNHKEIKKQLQRHTEQYKET